MDVNAIPHPLPAEALGRILCHEHLRSRREAVLMQFPHLFGNQREPELEKAVSACRHLVAKGISTVVDPSVLGHARDVRFMREVVQASGINVVCATGLYVRDKLPDHFADRPIEYMTDAFIHDIEIGVQGTALKAGVLKCVTDLPGLTPDAEKALRATSRAHRRTGVPIVTHASSQNRAGQIQLDVFDSEGVDPSAVLIGHAGDLPDYEYLESLVSRGAFIGMDRYGFPDGISTSERNEIVIEMTRRGHVGKMMLSQDSVTVYEMQRWEGRRDDWVLTYLVDKGFNLLLDQGLDPAALEQMLTTNAQTWLSPRQPY